jgi:hypothetical protein
MRTILWVIALGIAVVLGGGCVTSGSTGLQGDSGGPGGNGVGGSANAGASAAPAGTGGSTTSGVGGATSGAGGATSGAGGSGALPDAATGGTAGSTAADSGGLPLTPCSCHLDPAKPTLFPCTCGKGETCVGWENFQSLCGSMGSLVCDVSFGTCTPCFWGTCSYPHCGVLDAQGCNCGTDICPAGESCSNIDPTGRSGEGTCSACGGCAVGETCVIIGPGKSECCKPDCAGKQCGFDGCGGVCGTCPAAGGGAINTCIHGTCTVVVQTGCQTDLYGPPGNCGVSDTTGFPCVMLASARNLAATQDGGVWLGCAAGTACSTHWCSGTACTPSGSCAGSAGGPASDCGEDENGCSCGACPRERPFCDRKPLASAPKAAVGQCYCENICDGCKDRCTGKWCGGKCQNGACSLCQGSANCIEKPSGWTCCVPNCTGKTCGDDGCGGSCGSCATGQRCTANRCCTPNCTG